MLEHATAAAPPASATSNRPTLLLLGLGAFAVGTDAYVVAGLPPDLAQGLGVSQPAAGQAVTVFSFSYALMAPVLAAGIAVAGWGAGTWMQTAPQQYRLLASAPDAGRVVISLNASAVYFGIGLGGLPVGTLPLVGAAVAATALGVVLVSRDPGRR